MPDAVRAAVAPVTDAALRPIARILNTRTAYALRSADGGLVAEFVDDRVTATDARTGVVRTWREWEIELGRAASADPRAFFAAVEQRCARRGRPGRGIRVEARPRSATDPAAVRIGAGRRLRG